MTISIPHPQIEMFLTEEDKEILWQWLLDRKSHSTLLVNAPLYLYSSSFTDQINKMRQTLSILGQKPKSYNLIDSTIPLLNSEQYLHNNGKMGNIMFYNPYSCQESPFLKINSVTYLTHNYWNDVANIIDVPEVEALSFTPTSIETKMNYRYHINTIHSFDEDDLEENYLYYYANILHQSPGSYDKTNKLTYDVMNNTMVDGLNKAFPIGQGDSVVNAGRDAYNYIFKASLSGSRYTNVFELDIYSRERCSLRSTILGSDHTLGLCPTPLTFNYVSFSPYWHEPLYQKIIHIREHQLHKAMTREVNPIPKVYFYYLSLCLPINIL